MGVRGFVGYYTEETARGAKEYWLTVRLVDGWIAAYRVIYRGDGAHRRAHIGELRIVPALSGQHANFSPSVRYDFYERIAKAHGRTIPPFAFEAVRPILTPRFFADALAVLGKFRQDDKDDPWEDPLWPPPLGAARVEPVAPTRRAPGRPPRDPLFYAKLAVAYDQVEHFSRREPGASTRATLARRYKVPVTTIAKWIRTARQHKFLTPVRRGQRGGQAMPTAHELIARSHK